MTGEMFGGLLLMAAMFGSFAMWCRVAYYALQENRPIFPAVPIPRTEPDPEADNWVDGEGSEESGPPEFTADEPPGPPARPVLALVFSVGLLLILGGLQLLAALGPPPETPPQVSVETVLLDVGMKLGILFVLFAMLSGFTGTTARRFGLTTENWQTELVWAGRGFALSLAPVFCLMLGMAALKWVTEETAHPLIRMLAEPNGVWGVFLIAVTAVVVAPLVEELLFRVIIQGELERHASPSVAIGITAVVFSLVHGFPNAIGLLPLAVILGVLYHRRHRYITVVLVHAMFNAFNVGLALLNLM